MFVPLQLEGLRGFTAMKVGMMFFVPAVFTAVGMSLGGRLVDRVGPRRPIMIGCAGMIVALLCFSQLTLSTPVWVITALLSAQGIGMGFTMSPTMVAGLSELPARLVSQGSAVRSLISQVSGALAVAVLGSIVASKMGADPRPQQAQDAYNLAFLISAVGVAIALLRSSVGRIGKKLVVTGSPGAGGLRPMSQSGEWSNVASLEAPVPNRPAAIGVESSR